MNSSIFVEVDANLGIIWDGIFKNEMIFVMTALTGTDDPHGLSRINTEGTKKIAGAATGTCPIHLFYVV